MASETTVLRCAVYTRKSSEEGLEQEFNSLDAQREAAVAYIKSQAGEGWRVVRSRYDDGGYSGGNLERPGLERLLSDICEGKVDVVVVYKVDRLTRSLRDFAKLVDVFERRDVSFVSVTQQFNTTTSMGRLMLNVLLSFAQFEREVTGERIRDKIAASKRKGMWMGGVPPMGYRVEDRKLVLDEEEARRVRFIFRKYVELGCISRLVRFLSEKRYRTRAYVSAAGKTSGGRSFSRGHLHRILTNRAYIGEVVHAGESYPGQHEPIVDTDLWEQAQEGLRTGRPAAVRGQGLAPASALRGLVFDDAGNRMTPTHTRKGERRYRYYTSQALIQGRAEEAGSRSRVRAHELECVVVAAVKQRLGESGTSEASAARAVAVDDDASAQWLRQAIERVTVRETSVSVRLRTDRAAVCVTDGETGEPSACEFDVPFRSVERGGRTTIVTKRDLMPSDAAPDPHLLQALVRAHRWKRILETGEAASLSELARREGIHRAYLSRILRMAYLAPDLTEAILDGTQPPGLTVERLRQSLPLDWAEQRRLFGLAAS